MPNVYISLGVHGFFKDAPTTLNVFLKSFFSNMQDDCGSGFVHYERLHVTCPDCKRDFCWKCNKTVSFTRISSTVEGSPTALN